MSAVRRYSTIANFNPRSPHGERLQVYNSTFRCYCISIHAPRTGSDVAVQYLRAQTLTISIHAPRTGSDQNSRICQKSLRISIHAPRTGSDVGLQSVRSWAGNFNPRSPHGERPLLASQPLRGRISIHAPRTGSDKGQAFLRIASIVFQSTLPARGATYVDEKTGQLATISIHAPRTGSDERVAVLLPNGEVFQSTLPARGATCNY